MSEQAELLGLLAVHLTLTGLPGAAAALLAARRGETRVPVLLAVALAASAAVGLLGFWSFYADPLVGESCSYLAVFGSVALIVWCLHDGRLERSLLRELALPAALWVLGSAFIVFLGFAHGGSDFAVAMSSTRFSGQLPTDNAIPGFFADWFFHNGHDGTPPAFPGEWLSSDRPPLQVGYLLAQRPFGNDTTGVHYQVASVVLQQLWIVGLWALLTAARVGRLSRGLAAIAVVVSNLAIVNGFFVWPKLLPAALLLAAAALVLTPLWDSVRRSLLGAALVAALCGLAMMGHGSSVFGIVPLALVAAYRGLPSWRWLGVAAAVGAALLVSWGAYQKYDDPPGDRLAKWTLAGVVDVDDRGTLEAVADSYEEAGFGGTLHNKGQNLVTMAGGGPAWDVTKAAIESGDAREIVNAVRFISFLYLLPSLGLLLVGPLAMVLWRRRGRDRQGEWDFARNSFLVVAVGLPVWGLLVFGNAPDRTVIHVCSYLLPILCIVGAVVGLRAVLPRFAIWWVGLASLLSLGLYVPALTPIPGTSYQPLSFALAALALCGFATLALRGEPRPDSDRGSQLAQLRRPPLGPVEQRADSR